MSGEHRCGEVQKEVNESLREIKREIHQELSEHRKTLTDILQELARLTAQKPPCEEMRERIDKLENTKSFLHGGWTVGAMIACAIITAGSLVARLVLK